MPGDNKRRANELVATAAIPVAALLFIVGTLLAGIVVGIVVAVVGTAAVVLLLQRTALATVRRVVGGRPADPIADARLVNLIDNLASSAGVPAPELLVVDDAAPNALAAGLEPRTAVVAVTTGLLDLLDRVQLEGVLAHELARIKSYDTRPGTVAVPLLRWLGGIGAARDRIAATALGRGRLAEADLQGVAITRYPPALAAAFERMAEVGGTVRVAPAIAHLWIDPPLRASDPLVRPPLEQRIATLREL